MNVRIALMLVGGILGISQVAEAQLTQLRRDYQQPMTYSPADPFSKGWVYRLQTGQAGKYFNCDGEEQKRYSPYIYWQTVCNHTHPVPYCRVLLRDIHEVQERVRAGACRGGQNCQCADCQTAFAGGYQLAGQAVTEDVAPQMLESSPINQSAGTAVNAAPVAEEPQHVVYGSRSTRQRMAQQGSFAATPPAPAASETRTADRSSAPQAGGKLPR